MKALLARSFILAVALAGCTPPPPQPPRAATPQASCNCSMTSIIFFGPASAALSAKNQGAVQQDATIYAKQIPHPIVIAGGADLAEAGANAGVSLARAQAVASQLQTYGVPASEIIIRDNGTSHPLIPTGPNTSQIMNRYVMVQIQMAPAAPPPAAVTGPYQMHAIVLYQPNAVLQARLGPSGAQSLSAYIRQINTAIAPLFAHAPPQPGVTAALVIGVKPDGTAKSWIVDPNNGLPAPLASQIQSAIQTIPPVPVQTGPIVFAVIFNAWGGGAPITNPQHPLPTPQEWTVNAPAPESVPDGVFARIWP